MMSRSERKRRSATAAADRSEQIIFDDDRYSMGVINARTRDAEIVSFTPRELAQAFGMDLGTARILTLAIVSGGRVCGFELTDEFLKRLTSLFSVPGGPVQ